MNSIKRVVLMANNYDAVGGITTFVKTIAPGFRDAGFEVEIVTVESVYEDSKSLFDPSFKHRTGIEKSMPANRHFRRLKDRLKPAIYVNRFIYKRRQREASRNLARLYKSWGRDTVLIITQVYGAECLINGGIKLGNNKGPYVVGMYHDSFEEAAKGKNIKRLIKCFMDIDKFLVLTKIDADLFREEGFTNVSFIHNPVSIEAPNRPIKKDNLVVSLGRYHPQKSLDYLIKAWAEIASDFPDWRLEMYGGGGMQAKLQKLIDELTINDSARLMGATDQVGKLLGRSSIYALSSQHEGLPLAIVEAARFNVPTVAFDCAPGIAELVDHDKSGIIVPRNNVHLLAEGLKQLMSNHKLCEEMGVAARKKSNEYKVNTIIEKWAGIFDELII